MFKICKPLIFLVVLGVSGSVLSYKLDEGQPLDLPREYKNICERELGNCLRLKNRYGWIKPPKHVQQLIKNLKTYILKYSSEFDVMPEAIAGVILAEEALNVSHTDYFQNVIVHVLGEKGKILWDKMTYGLGQLSLEPLKDANSFLNKERGDDILSETELSQIPFNAELAVKYIAVIIKIAEQEYLKQGFNIHRDLGVLASLYNLGDANKRAQLTSSNGLRPRMNYFGFYVQLNAGLIRTILEEGLAK